MSKRMWTDRSVVYVVTAGDDFVPRSAWDFPETFTGAKLQTRNVPLEDARAMVRGFNKTAIERRDTNTAAWDHAWAIAVACPRAKGLDRLVRVRSANLAPRTKGATA
jgi:hypothetical protein